MANGSAFILTHLILLGDRYAGAVFANACLKGLNGVPDVVECSFVQSTVTELPFFASKVHFLFTTFFVCCSCDLYHLVE
jgi:hypothetical protein